MSSPEKWDFLLFVAINSNDILTIKLVTSRVPVIRTIYAEGPLILTSSFLGNAVTVNCYISSVKNLSSPETTKLPGNFYGMIETK